MRLNAHQAKVIRDTARSLLGEHVRVTLFGSRIDDARRGGDIDLLIETEQTIPNRAETLCRLYGALTLALGDRKLDVLLKDGRTRETPVISMAKRTGVIL